MAQGGNQPCAHAQLALHVRAADVQITIAQARVLAHGIVEHERQRRGGIEHFHRRGQHFDLARVQTFIDLACRPTAHFSRYAQTILIANLLGRGESRGIVRLDHDLDDAFMITQIDEDHAAVIAAGISPAAESDVLIDQGLIDETAVMGTHALRLQNSGRIRGRRIAHPTKDFVALQTKRQP